MKKSMRAALAGVFLASFSLLAFHAHDEHTGDLHKSHAPCAVCAHSSQFRQKAVPQAAAAAPSDLSLGKILFNASEDASSDRSAYSQHSRAPPV